MTAGTCNAIDCTNPVEHGAGLVCGDCLLELAEELGRASYRAAVLVTIGALASTFEDGYEAVYAAGAVFALEELAHRIDPTACPICKVAAATEVSP